LPVGGFNYGESEKENENSIKSFKSPTKIHHTSMVVVRTEEEMKYRNKYYNGKMEAGNCTNSKPELCLVVLLCLQIFLIFL
jgi:hypothetical protein